MPRGFIILFAKISPRRSRGDIILIITYRAGYKIILTEQVLKLILVALVVGGMQKLVRFMGIGFAEKFFIKNFNGGVFVRAAEFSFFVVIVQRLCAHRL